MRLRAKGWRKSGVAALSVGLHALALWALVLRPDPPAMAAGPGAAIAVTLVAAPRQAPPAVEPELVEAAVGASEETVPPPDVAQATPAEAPQPEPAPPEGAGVDTAGCALSDDVLAALQADAPRAALARIPERRRSVAGAVMLWDGGWVRTGALADPRVARPIQAAIAGAVHAAEPACAAAQVDGPVLFIMPDADGSLVLVVGSGAWRWADLTAAHPTAAGGR